MAINVNLLPSGKLVRLGSFIPNGTTGDPDKYKAGPSSVVKFGPADYRCWYEGIDQGSSPSTTTTCLATSTTGLAGSWTKYAGNPVMVPSLAWELADSDYPEASPDCVIPVGSTLYLFYHGGGNSVGTRKIGLATSTDGGYTWVKEAAPILDKGSGGAWDENSVADPKVIRMSASDWRMWFTGRNNAGDSRIGYATATAREGPWTKSGSNPVLSPGSLTFENKNIANVGVVYDATIGGFLFWYAGQSTTGSGQNDAIGFAYSSDGPTIIRGANNPVLLPLASNTGEDIIGDTIDVLHDGNRFVVWYGGNDEVSSPRVESRFGAQYIMSTLDAPITFSMPSADGNAYPSPVNFNPNRQMLPAFAKDVDGKWHGRVRVPRNYVSNGRIVLTVTANATSGVTTLIVSTAKATDLSGTYDPSSLTAETTQDVTVSGTAYGRKDVTFPASGSLATSIAALDDLIVEVFHNGVAGNDTLNAETIIYDAFFTYSDS